MLEGCGRQRDPNQAYLVLCVGNKPLGCVFPKYPSHSLGECQLAKAEQGSTETGSSLDNLDNRRPELQPGTVLVQT